MQNRALGNDDYITAVYRTVLDRDPDEEGRNNAHVNFNVYGWSAMQYLNYMLETPEFTNKLEQQLPDLWVVQQEAPAE